MCGTPDLQRFRPVAKKVIDSLRSNKADHVVERCVAEALGMKGVALEDMDADVLITVGGDGTILRTLQSSDAPVLGVNAGVLGFLTEIQPREVDEAVKMLLAGRYHIDKRIKLKTVMNGKRLKDATNEAVVHTAHIAKMRHFVISIDGTPATEVRCDGLIIATPTGSTSYAMSVGSSIIDPRVEAFVIAPIAPFRLASRPLVVSAKSKIAVTIKEPKDCTMVIDGQCEFMLSGEERLMFTASEKKAKFVSFKQDFYRNLEEKLIASAPFVAHRH